MKWIIADTTDDTYLCENGQWSQLASDAKPYDSQEEAVAATSMQNQSSVQGHALSVVAVQT